MWSPFLPVLLLCGLMPLSLAWDSGDLELFDLVEEIQRNFYEFLGVEQDASSVDIRKAYRRLSLLLHPDKNKDEDAETQFRQLVSIYEVLKDEERRQRYDDILVNGLPDWRQPVFYYRRVRRMSNAELALLLFIILTVGHYAVVWSIYLEKQLDELLSRKKKEKRKKAAGKGIDDTRVGQPEKNERLFEKPQWHDLLPCKVSIWIYLAVKSIPQVLQEARQFYSEYHEKRAKEKEEALAQSQLETLQKEKKPKVKKPKSEFPVYAVADSSAYVPSYDQGGSIEDIEEQIDNWLENKIQKKKNPGWTEEDICQLARNMVKFPGGTPGRWEKIAHELGRSVSDVTTKAKQMKDSVTVCSGTVRLSELKSTAQILKGAKTSVSMPDNIITQREEEEDLEETDNPSNRSEFQATETRHRKRKPMRNPEATLAVKDDVVDKSRGKRQKDFDSTNQVDGEDFDSDDETRKREKGHVLEELWTQNQQKLLELALQQYPKGTVERWEKIAKCVPGKCKEECMVRYKMLVELVQKKKQAKS